MRTIPRRAPPTPTSRWRWKLLCVAAAWLTSLVAPSLIAALPPSLSRTVYSSTGQFVVQATPPSTARQRFLGPVTNTLVQLEADSLAVICERIKGVLLRELNLADLWQSRIHVVALAYAQPDQSVNLTSVRYPDTWRYQVEIPERVPPEKLIRGLSQAILLEIANRPSRNRSAELPIWLVEGVSFHLLNAYRSELVLHPQTYTLAAMTRPDPLANARLLLQERKPLTFGELSLPSSEALSPPHVALYQACAQIFWWELERLPNGRETMIRFLTLLPQNLNWQTAFLRAYSRHFRSLLEVEKWWALTLTQVTGRNPTRVWPLDVASSMLAELLQVSYRPPPTNAFKPPTRLITLQQVITNLHYPVQKSLLRQKIQQINLARINMPPALVPLADSYARVLNDYILRRDRAGFSPEQRGAPFAAIHLIAEDTLHKLDELARRLHPSTPAPAPDTPEPATQDPGTPAASTQTPKAAPPRPASKNSSRPQTQPPNAKTR